MAFMGFLKVGSQVTITFEANQNNEGNSHVIADFKLDLGQGKQMLIMPGFSDEINYDPLPNGQQLRIRTTPSENGGGILSVTENGVIKNSRTITRNTIWDYALPQPAENPLFNEPIASNEEE